MFSRSAGLLPLCALSVSVQAAEQAAPRVPGVETLFSTLVALAFVLMVIFGGAWLLRRVGGVAGGGRGVVRVLGGASVGVRERVVVVQVDDARLVLGVAPGQVRKLHELPAVSDFDKQLDQARDQTR